MQEEQTDTVHVLHAWLKGAPEDLETSATLQVSGSLSYLSSPFSSFLPPFFHIFPLSLKCSPYFSLLRSSKPFQAPGFPTMSKAELGALHKWHAWDTWSWAWQWGLCRLCKANISQQEHDAPICSPIPACNLKNNAGICFFCFLLSGEFLDVCIEIILFFDLYSQSLAVWCSGLNGDCAPERLIILWPMGWATHKVRFRRPICPMICVHHARSIYYFKTKNWVAAGI